MEIFTSAVSQHQNLGDVVLRRKLVESLSRQGQVALLAVGCSDAHVERIQGTSSTVRYDSRLLWLLHLGKAVIRRRAALVYSPGPQTLQDGGREICAEASRLLLSTVLRSLGTPVLRVGRSFEGNGWCLSRLVRAHSRALAYSSRRDARMKQCDPRGIVVPDIAIGWGIANPMFSGRYLLVSVRFDRGHDLIALSKAIKKLEKTLCLRAQVITQVDFDRDVNDQLATLLDCDHVLAMSTSDDPLSTVQHTYTNAALVVSDRLHALIFGIAHGALPVALRSNSLEARPDKVTAALTQIGVPFWHMVPKELTEIDPRDVANRRRQASIELTRARTALASAEARMSRVLRGR